MKQITDQYNFSEEQRHKEMFFLSRIYTVSHRKIENYHLNLLLRHVKRATYKKIRTVDGVGCASFEEACRRSGKRDIEKNSVWFSLLKELFKTNLVHCFCSDPNIIYEENVKIILQNLRHPQGSNNFALLRTDRNEKKCTLLQLID